MKTLKHVVAVASLAFPTLAHAEVATAGAKTGLASYVAVGVCAAVGMLVYLSNRPRPRVAYVRSRARRR
jgi:hypothetical protein